MEIIAHIMIGLGVGFILMFVLVLWSMQIDYRIVIATLFGALLPDLIDKPLFILNLFGNGRVGAHSIIALVVVFAIAAYLWYSGHRELAIIVMCVGIGMLSHQLADRMWIPKYIDEWLWPFAGPLHTQDPGVWVAKHLPNILSVNFIKY